MKKIWRTAAICVAIYVLSFGVTAAVMSIDTVERDVVTASVSADTVSEEPVYMLKTYNGRVTVFIDGEPTIETDILLTGLRQNDREMLEQGIVVESYTDVLCMLEDFGS